MEQYCRYGIAGKGKAGRGRVCLCRYGAVSKGTVREVWVRFVSAGGDWTGLYRRGLNGTGSAWSSYFIGGY